VGARCGKSARRVLLGAGGVSLRSTDRHLPKRDVEERAAGRSPAAPGIGASPSRSRPSADRALLEMVHIELDSSAVCLHDVDVRVLLPRERIGKLRVNLIQPHQIYVVSGGYRYSIGPRRPNIRRNI
jgi:hypothetical protein